MNVHRPNRRRLAVGVASAVLLVAGISACDDGIEQFLFPIGRVDVDSLASSDGTVGVRFSGQSNEPCAELQQVRQIALGPDSTRLRFVGTYRPHGVCLAENPRVTYELRIANQPARTVTFVVDRYNADPPVARVVLPKPVAAP